ncbi:MAG: DUF5668 domain-containing protein [Bacteroidales bacterium]|nr:DUF5668 domain-containing protein [Bacteroidales bacterium]MDZ4204565.1 DUF5668 domain-containing protein [Bacteroidales bacterium]
MNYKKVFWGVLFILIGGVIVLRNLGVIWFEWWQLWRLWPLLLIIWGIAMLPIKGGIKLLLTILAVAAGVFLIHKYDIGPRWQYERPFRFRFDDDWNRNNPKQDRYKKWSEKENWESQHLFFPFSDDIQRATLRLDAAAGSFNLQQTSDNLVEMIKEGNIGSYSLTATENEDMHIVRLSLEEGRIRGDNLRHKVEIKLHESPLWDFDLDIGAAKINMDLSGFKTKQINVDGGASSIFLRLGDKHSLTHIEMDAGASSITIEVPQGSGCQVKANSVLSGKTLKDFRKVDGNLFETENFSESTNKIYINVDVAVSSLEVKRY